MSVYEPVEFTPENLTTDFNTENAAVTLLLLKMLI